MSNNINHNTVCKDCIFIEKLHEIHDDIFRIYRSYQQHMPVVTQYDTRQFIADNNDDMLYTLQKISDLIKEIHNAKQ